MDHFASVDNSTFLDYVMYFGWSVWFKVCYQVINGQWWVKGTCQSLHPYQSRMYPYQTRINSYKWLSHSRHNGHHFEKCIGHYNWPCLCHMWDTHERKYPHRWGMGNWKYVFTIRLSNYLELPVFYCITGNMVVDSVYRTLRKLNSCLLT